MGKSKLAKREIVFCLDLHVGQSEIFEILSEFRRTIIGCKLKKDILIGS